MAEISRPVSPQEQHAPTPQISTDTPLIRRPSLPNPISPTSTAPPLTAPSQHPTAGAPPTQAAPPNPPTSTNAQRLSPTSHKHTTHKHKARRRPSEKAYQAFRTFASPSTHDVGDFSELPVPSTTRDYDRKTQRWRLWNLVWLEWVITGAFCLALWGVLFAYSRHHIEVNGGLTVQARRIFNALATGLSIGLGLNLAGSLRSYAKILRWRLLATKYRPLTEFELVLGVEKQTNLLRLIWQSRNPRYRFLPSVTQLLCVVWIAVNVAAAILVSMLGLTYNINQSTSYVSVSNGPVSVADFTQFDAPFPYGLAFIQGLAQGGTSLGIDIGTLAQGDEIINTYETMGNRSRYWFSDYDPNDFSIELSSTRYIDAVGSCVAFPVIEGVFGNESSITYVDNGRSVKRNIPIAAQPGPGGLVFIGETAQTCGTRCTAVSVFQAQADSDELDSELSYTTKAQFFSCNNTVSQVANVPAENYEKYLMSDDVARAFAGALAWSGEQISGDSEQYQAYAATNGITYALSSIFTAANMAQSLSQYSIGAVADVDDLSNDSVDRQTIQGGTPGFANYLQVVWWHAGPLLIGIPLLQLASLLAVIAIGNRAVIKDDSYLAIAELYRSTVDRLGNHGSILRGEEIINALKDPIDGQEPKVIYAWKNVGSDENGQLRRVDVFDDKSNVQVQAQFVPGRYD